MGPTVLFILAVLPLTVSGSPTKTKCRFGNTTYEAGDTWHPRVSDNGSDERNCVICKCNQVTGMNCTNNDCVSACRGRSKEDLECCNICSEADVGGPAFRTQTREVRVSSSEYCNTRDGKRYRVGEKFTSNNSGLTPPKSSQCVQCICMSNLATRCAVEDCPRAYCDSPIKKPGLCCPVCPVSMTPGRATHRTTGGVAGSVPAHNMQATESVGPMDMGQGMIFLQKPSSRTGNDCVSGGKLYPNGATWHPVMGPFGRLTCDQCNCSAGTVECSHFQCPKVTCGRPPVFVFGQCCPVCPDSEDAGQAADRPLVKCLPAQRFMIVWKSHGGANISQYIQYIFQRPGVVSEKHEWVMNNGRVQIFRVVRLDDRSVANLMKVGSYKMLGIINQNRLRKFHKRENDLKVKCRLRCSGERVSRLERTLRLRKPNQRRGTCKSHEREIRQ